MRGPAPVTLLPALAGAAWCTPALAPLSPAVCGLLGLRRVAADGVHLTFDDGPHPQGTPAVLDVLARHGARATFFLVGEQVRRDPALAREVAAAGHVVALHGDRHRCLLRVGPRALADDLARGYATIADAAGAPAPLYRPPYGIPSAAGLALARRRGWATWLWSRWGRDWRADATPATVARLAGEGLRGGDVVLLHDADHYGARGSWHSTVGALPRILEAAAAAGLRPRALGAR
jgi:peptidoglycan/xylan/chitin deacetylase (PgdA/CDA1 family)